MRHAPPKDGAAQGGVVAEYFQTRSAATAGMFGAFVTGLVRLGGIAFAVEQDEAEGQHAEDVSSIHLTALIECEQDELADSRPYSFGKFSLRLWPLFADSPPDRPR